MAPDLPLFRDVPAEFEQKPVDKIDVWWFELLKMKGSSGQIKYSQLQKQIHVLLALRPAPI